MLIYQQKFAPQTIKTRHPIRQKLSLLIFNRNFRDSKSARFQRLSASIGRFSTSAATNHYPLSREKIPSAPMARSLCEVERLASPKLENFLPYHAVRVGLLARTQRPEAARAVYCKALALEPNPAGRRWLERKAALLVTP